MIIYLRGGGVMNRFIYNSQYGEILIEGNGESIIKIQLIDETTDTNNLYETQLIRLAYNQLMEYFGGKRQDFDFPIDPAGTEFQNRVWNAIVKVPYGQTRSYKDIAEFIENPKAYRAVGLANNKNPIQIVIPCHRIIGSNKKLVGYRGGLEIKEKLLQLEKKNASLMG